MSRDFATEAFARTERESDGVQSIDDEPMALRIDKLTGYTAKGTRMDLTTDGNAHFVVIICGSRKGAAGLKAAVQRRRS